jgi:predicted metal-dependent phosphoesterase TrpH
VIDLHLHTTASDGRCTPQELVTRACAAGLTVMAATDHDTTAAVAEVQALARARGVEAISGIEITAVDDGVDVHVLGYFIDVSHGPLGRFLASQRASRVARLESIASRLGELGLPVDIERVLAGARQDTSKAVGRPDIARAMIEAGYVTDIGEAFDRWLGRSRAAFVPRPGATAESVVATIHDAGGLASLAHPGRTGIDARLPSLREAGLDAIEAFHSDHAPQDVQRYQRLAAQLGLLVTGGSDFHGYPGRGVAPGSASLPREEWDRLRAARARHAG